MGLFSVKKKPVKQERPYQEESEKDSYEVEEENKQEEENY